MNQNNRPNSFLGQQQRKRCCCEERATQGGYWRECQRLRDVCEQRLTIKLQETKKLHLEVEFIKRKKPPSSCLGAASDL